MAVGGAALGVAVGKIVASSVLVDARVFVGSKVGGDVVVAIAMGVGVGGCAVIVGTVSGVGETKTVLSKSSDEKPLL